MARITATDLGRLRAWIEAGGEGVPAADRALFARLLRGELLNDPDAFEREMGRNATLRDGFARAFRTPDARAALADSYDALQRLVAGRAAATPPAPARAGAQPDRKNGLLAYVLREEPGVDRWTREWNFLQQAHELDYDDLVWLRVQLVINGESGLSALVAFIISSRNPRDPHTDDEELAFTSLRAAAERTRGAGALAELYLRVVLLVPHGGPRQERLQTALPGFLERASRVVAGQREIPLADQRRVAQFYEAVASTPIALHQFREPGERMPTEGLLLAEEALGRAARIYTELGEHAIAGDLHYTLATYFQTYDHDYDKAIFHLEREDRSFAEWLRLHPGGPIEPLTVDIREQFPSPEAPPSREEGSMTVRMALLRRARASFVALHLAQQGGEEETFRRVLRAYQAALQEFSRRVGEVTRDQALRDIGQFLEAAAARAAQGPAAAPEPPNELLAFYQDLFSSGRLGQNPITLLLLSGLVIVVLKGSPEVRATAEAIKSVLEGGSASLSDVEALARILIVMPHENFTGGWVHNRPTPEMIAAAQERREGQFWNGIFDLVQGPDTHILGRRLAYFAMSLNLGPADTARNNGLLSTLTQISLHHATSDFEFRRIMIAVLLRASAEAGKARNAEDLFRPLERIARLLGDSATYQEGLRAGAEYANGPAGGKGGPAGSGGGEGSSVSPGGRMLLAGKPGPALGFGALVVEAEDSTPVPAGDLDAADTTADAGAAWYLGADAASTLPIAPIAAPATAPMK